MRPRPPASLWRALVAATATAVLTIAVGGSAATAAAPSPTLVAASSTPTPEQQLLSLINKERAKAGLPGLTAYRTLNNASEEWAAHLARTSKFEHSTADWRLSRIGAGGWAASGENLAAGYTSAAAAVQGWMNSSGHRANILNTSYRGIGLGYVNGGPYGHYWVTIFGIAKPTMPTVVVPQLSGTSKVGGTIKGSAARGWPTGTSVTYQWLSNGKVIAGATRSSMVVSEAVAGTKLSVKVSATNSRYFPASTRSANSRVVAWP